MSPGSRKTCEPCWPLPQKTPPPGKPSTSSATASREIGSLAAALGGLDALIFTGGIGEHAAPVRAQIGEGCRWLGVEIDAKTNETVTGAQRISTAGAKTIACVIPTNEEWMIARHTVRLL